MFQAKPDASHEPRVRVKWQQAAVVPLLLLAALLMAFLGQPTARAWSGDPTINTPICTAEQDQLWNNMPTTIVSRPNIVSDGSGGAIITWHDNRTASASGFDIYVQRLDVSGTALWGTGGRAVCTAPGSQESPCITSDGLGGAIITWQDRRSGTSYDIYAQRIGASGQVPEGWPVNGCAVCTSTRNQVYPTIIGDGLGGAIITWQDYRSGTNYDIYAENVGSTGSTPWPTDNGVAICTATGNQSYQSLVSDGSGGAIIAWQDYRSGTDYDVYAERVDSSGSTPWPTDNGVAICMAIDNQQYPNIVGDGSGGAIATWQDNRGGSSSDIYAERVDSSGSTPWPTDNGVAICSAADSQQYPNIVTDGSGGAFVTWQDRRGGTYYDIYAQRMNNAGTPLWDGEGAEICAASRNQINPTLISDGSGGAIIAWQDYRNYISSGWDIYAQRVDSSGHQVEGWTANGVQVSVASSTQQNPVLAGDGTGGAVIAWRDYRNSAASRWDLYAQKVKGNGTLPIPPTLTAINPTLGDRNQIISDITISGTNFITEDTSVSFGPDITVVSLSVDSPTQIRVSISIDLAATLGTRDVSVTTSEGMAVLSGVFTVCPALQVDFVADKTVAVVGDLLTFTNGSAGGAAPLSYWWDFDNNATRDSTAEDPTYAYSMPGTYTVVLRVTDNATNMVTETKTDYITVHDTLEADFGADRTEVAIGQTISFDDLSTGGIPALSYRWEFGDSENSTAENPTHAYNSIGTYTVVLQVTDNTMNTDTETKTDYIVVSDAVNAGFTGDRTAVVVGQTIEFADASGGGVAPLSYEWDFENDGTLDSTAQNPTHAYADAGTYTVVLRVTDSASNTDTETRTDYVTVSAALQADFTADDTVAMAGQDVQFTEGCSGGVAPLSYLWDFGDSENSTDQNPTHAYTGSGTYTVALTVSDSAGNSAETTRAEYITVVESCDSTSTAGGTGTVEICTSDGVLVNLVSVPEDSVPVYGRPLLNFPHGLFAFEIIGLSSGESVTLTVALPSATPTTTQYWKYGPTTADPLGGWYAIPMGSNDGDNVITITLTDGGLGDDDLTADGSIVDQGGPGTPRPPEPAPAFPGIYVGIVVSLGAGVIAYLIRRSVGSQ